MSEKSINRKRIKNTTTKINPTTSQINILDKDKNIWIYLLILVIFTSLVFSPTFKNTFTNWDDEKYVADNPLIEPLDYETVSDMFFSDITHHKYWMGNYHPLTMLSLNLNYAIAKKDASGNVQSFVFQFTNILLHVLNTLLVFLFIRLLLKNNDIAFFSALLFGVHTLHVESVSWISERKDVLYSFFYLISLIMYTKFVHTKKHKYYFFAFLVFFLSLLSKGQATTLAVTIILVDYFNDRKLLSRRVIIEKIPFLILAFIFGLISIEAQKQGNALQVVNSTPLLNRFGIAAYGFSMYLLKLLLPIKLSAVYPYPDIIYQTIPWYFWLGFISVFLVILAGLKVFKKDKVIFFGLSFFIVNIFLLLQLLPVGSAIYADRYVYIPSIGFYLIISYFIFKIKSSPYRYGLFVSYLILLSFLTVTRIGVWRDSNSLWTDVVDKQPKSVIGWNNLGGEYNNTAEEYKNSGEREKYKALTEQAIRCFDEAILKKPDYSSAFYNRGLSKYNLGEFLSDSSLVITALSDFNRAISNNLTFVDAYLQRGLVYEWLGEYQKAIADFNYGLQYDSKNENLLINRAVAMGKSGDLTGAIENLTAVLANNPQSSAAYSNRGLAYSLRNDFDLALSDFSKSLMLSEQGGTFYNRAMVYYNINDDEKAIDDFNKALSLQYSTSDLYYFKAICEKRSGKNQAACEDIKIAVQMGVKITQSQLDNFCK